MRRFIFFVFVSALLIKNATSSKNQGYPSHLAWLFGLNSKLNENKENKEESNEGNKPTVCQTQECKKIAQIFLESMDKSVDPCEDFYEYACGKWPEHNPIPIGGKTWNMYALGTRIVMKKTKEIFDEGPKDDDLLAIKLAKKWYAVCMNTDAMDRQGLEPLVFTLSRIGGWPMIMEPDEWNEQEYSWQKVDDQYMRLMGRNAFHDVRVIEQERPNASQKRVHIDTPHLTSDPYNLWNSKIDFSEEDESDEDPSDEEEQSGEQGDSPEPGSEGENYDESDYESNDDNDDDDDDNNNSYDGNEDDNNYSETNDQGNSQEPGSEGDNYNRSNNSSNVDDDDDDDNDNHDVDKDGNEDDVNDNKTNEQSDDDENSKKKISMRKSGKFAKNKKVRYNKKIKSSSHSKKHRNHKTKKERVKRRVLPINISEKLRSQKNERRIHMRRARKEKLNKTLEATTPQVSTEETTDEDKKKKQYTDYISKVARAIAKARGLDVTEKHMNKDIRNMIDFQLILANITVDNSDEEDMTLNEFQEWYDKKKPKTVNSMIDWVYKIRELFDEAYVPVKGDLNLRIKSPGYFKDLIALLDKTSSRTIVNYVHWNFLSKIIRTTTSEMRKLYNTWEGNDENDSEENGNEGTFGFSARAQKCMREIRMSDLLAYEYVRNQFPVEVKTTTTDMMDDIQKEVEYQIKESDWMDEDTKDFVLAKLINMKKFIGYPDWYRNDTIVKRYFQGLIIINSYYENTLSYNRYSKWKALRQLTKNITNDGIMTMSPLLVNAMFSYYENSVDLPAANFQNPFFAYNRPQAINYGIVGSTIGHEVNHGFDNNGHLYSKNGDEVEWLSVMAEAYSKRAECFVEQFNNYPIDKASNYTIKNYGNQTISENIADTMGLEATFRAYRRRERECGNSGTVLPGLEDLTNDQLFFLSFGFVSNIDSEGRALSCEVQSNITRSRAKYDSHSIERLRVIGSVSNSQDFAKAYNCPLGSAMNPERKCNIWK